MSARLRSNTKATVATCNLNQWALDFNGNLKRTEQSIREAKARGARYRLGPELELCGYSCEDHFLETDTYLHCTQSLAELLSTDATDGILCDIGMPVLHNNVRYNCRVFCLDRKILLIRPKTYLADDGLYREGRFFTPWKFQFTLEEHRLTRVLADVTGQTFVKFGVGAIMTSDTIIASETCEELWTPRAPHIELVLAGVEILGNGSGSHHQLRKLNTRLDLVKNAMTKCGGVYLYANLRGCDGQRAYFDGSSMICLNGDVLSQATQFSLNDVEVITAVVDLTDVRSMRGASASLQQQSSEHIQVPMVHTNFRICRDECIENPSPPIDIKYFSPEEECALGPACWMWDYLRRSGASGFLLPLSGGADSASTATIVYAMCDLVVSALEAGNMQVESDTRRLLCEEGLVLPISRQQLANRIFHTVYMGTENSSNATLQRARRLAESIGAYHIPISIDTIVRAIQVVFTVACARSPKYECDGGTAAEDLALQNIQARTRMVCAYLFAQLLPWVRGRKGFLLVLSSANVDESLRGYFTKYDCSSADLNPIGGTSKKDLKRMMRWAADRYALRVLIDVIDAVPTAELRPIAPAADGTLSQEPSQADEAEMGMTYEELSWFGYYRKVKRSGPVYMFERLCVQWPHLPPEDVAIKVKRFFYYYSINRHKMTTLTPSYHAEQYSPDDHRFDLRPFLYNVAWERQFQTIDAIVESIRAHMR